MGDYSEELPPSAEDIALNAERNGGHQKPRLRTSAQITKENAARLGIDDLDAPAYARDETAFQQLAKRLHNKIWKKSPPPPPSV